MPRSLLLAVHLLALLGGPVEAQWAQLNGPLPPRASGFARADGVMVMGTHQSDAGDVYRSDDGGQTWANAGLPNNGILAAHAAGPAFFVGTYLSGAHRSDDGGLTWTRMEGLGSSVGSFSGTADRLYAGGDGFLAPAGVFRSTDGGATWTEVLAGLNSRALYSDGLLALAGGSGAAGLYRSADGGDTWSAVPSFTGGAWTVGALAADGAALYAGVRHSTDAALRGVYRSTNGGQSWAKVSADLPSLLVRSLVVRGATALAIMMHAEFLGGTLWRSTDGGVTWAEVPVIPSNEVLWTLFDGGDAFWLGSSRGAFRSTDGLAWRRSDTGAAAISGVASLLTHGDALLVGLTDNGGGGRGLWRTDNLGVTWTLLEGGLSDRAAIRALHREGATLFAGDSGSFPRGVYRSDDAGVTWAFSSAGINTSTIINDIHGHNGVLLVGAYEALYRSTDGGATWAIVPSMNGVQTLASYRGALWAGRADGRVYGSGDDGLTWTSVGPQLASLGVEALVVSRGALYAATHGAGVFRLSRSPDGEPQWVPAGLQGAFADVLVDVHGVLVAATPLEGLFYSPNGGASWIPAEEGYAGGEVYELAATTRHLVAGTRGHALWANPLRRPEAVPAAEAESPATAPVDLAITPNPVPAGRTATLALHLTWPATVIVTVYDALGRRVHSEAFTLTDGPHRLPLAGQGLAPGVYLVRAETGAQVETGRLTVVR